jgi:hypothetical protein
LILNEWHVCFVFEKIEDDNFDLKK